MRLILMSAGERTISVIKEIRSFTGSTLKDAKDMATAPDPVQIYDGPAKHGMVFRAALVTAGATVRIEGARNPLPRWLRALADWLDN